MLLIIVCMMFCKKCSLSRSFCHLHLSMVGIDRCCKHQALFKRHKSQTERLECSKTPGREPHLCSRPFGLELGLAPIGIHRLLLSNLTTGYDFGYAAITGIGALFTVTVFMCPADVCQDWSDHALWWPERNLWLLRTRSTLDQYGVAADAHLLFTAMHKPLRVLLPDLQDVDVRANFAADVFNVVIRLCKEFGQSESVNNILDPWTNIPGYASGVGLV